MRRAKLYYLRDRVGKNTRVRELLGEKVRRERAQEKAEREAQAAQLQAAQADSGEELAEAPA